GLDRLFAYCQHTRKSPSDWYLQIAGRCLRRSAGYFSVGGRERRTGGGGTRFACVIAWRSTVSAPRLVLMDTVSEVTSRTSPRASLLIAFPVSGDVCARRYRTTMRSPRLRSSNLSIFSVI